MTSRHAFRHFDQMKSWDPRNPHPCIQKQTTHELFELYRQIGASYVYSLEWNVDRVPKC